MQSFASYRNLVEIGRGGMATVYRATASNGNLVALKVLAHHLVSDDSARQRFQQESNLDLIHPNIVHVVDRGIADGVPYFAMEYVVGDSLDRILLRRGRLAPLELLPVLKDAARALDYAHRRGVIHRDVKPSNILVRENGQALLADFGVAKAGERTAYTATRVRIGSAYYMSPEQALGMPEITKAADIYALGVTAYYALTGRHPFEGDSEIAVARMHVDQPPAPLTALDRAIPDGVSQAVLWALAKAPANRPASASQFVYELEKALETPAAPPRATPVVLAAPVRAPVRALAPPAARVGRAAAGGLVALVVLGGLMAVLAVALSMIGQNRTPPVTASAIPATRILPSPMPVEPAGGAPAGGAPATATPAPPMTDPAGATATPPPMPSSTPAPVPPSEVAPAEEPLPPPPTPSPAPLLIATPTRPIVTRPPMDPPHRHAVA